MLNGISNWLLAKQDFILEYAVAVFIAYVVAHPLVHFLLRFLEKSSRPNLSFWSWLQYYLRIKPSLCWPVRRWVYPKSHSFHIVSLDDYVTILERLRNKIVNRCKNKSYLGGPKPEIAIHIYTMQLPRDWPLWDSSNRDGWGRCPLEQYLANFNQFLLNAEADQYRVALQRVIVIDNCWSPTGLRRQYQLREDINSDYFKNYIQMLHNDDNDTVRVCLYPRFWPGWLSDTVFYGVKDPTSSREWLWGVTTSYNAAEDLVLLRTHKFSRKRPPGEGLVLPFQHKVLAGLADAADEFPSLETLR